MTFYQIVQRVLLAGVHLERSALPAAPVAPAELGGLIRIVEPVYRRFDALAVRFGDSYRSGFWAIYLISALAVLCGVLPLALGWDSRFPEQHPAARLWAFIEVGLIITVIVIYWRGHQAKWRSEWLAARTTAELAWYLPLLAPLVELDRPGLDANWYHRIFEGEKRVPGANQIEVLCGELEPLARQGRAGAWAVPGFAVRYLTWAIQIFEQQRAYHHRLALRQEALLHRAHRINNVLFGLTALGAAMHLLVHSLWLTLVTTFFPSLAASLHGALAQSEAFRLARTSEQMAIDLKIAIARLEQVLAGPAPSIDTARILIGETLTILLREHQAWHMLVRPHDLPLA